MVSPLVTVTGATVATAVALRGTHRRTKSGGRGRGASPRSDKAPAAIPRDADAVTRRGLTRTKASEREEGDVADGDRRAFFAAATGLFSPHALKVDANRDARTNLPLGPACLLDDADAPAPRGGVSGRIWGNGVLALMLGAAGFGRVHHAPMNDYAHAAVTTGSVAKGGVSSKAGEGSLGGGRGGMEPSAAHIEEHGGSRVYSKTLLPGVKSAKGKLRQHPDHIGPVPNPHFEDVVCSKWFVGSLNALG